MNGTRLDNTTYYYANGEIVARKDSAGMHYYHGDQLGSTSLITDANGNVEETTRYYPYGALRSGGAKTKYLFNGKELAAATGLYYYLNRWYYVNISHWTQPDPIIPNVYDPQTLNRYSYVRNNPLRYTDPTGNYLESALDIAFIALDLNDVSNDPGNLWNYASLGADVGGLLLPGITGGRVAVKAVEYGGDVGKALEVTNRADKAVDAAKTVEKTGAELAKETSEQTTKEYLEGVATRADGISSEKGHVWGSRKHTEAERITNAERPGMPTEVTYKNGEVVPYRTKGAVRVDAVEGSKTAPTAAYDYKFGDASLTDSRISQLRQHLPESCQSIYEVKPKPIFGKT